jgi:hypothetical protein
MSTVVYNVFPYEVLAAKKETAEAGQDSLNNRTLG